MNDLFCSFSSSPGKYKSTDTQMPISWSPEERVTEMLKYIFYGDEGQVLRAKDSYFLRTQLLALPFLLHASKTKSLHSPPVPQGFPSGSISPWCSDNDQGKTRHKDLPIHEAPAMRWNHRGYRNRAEGKSGPIVFWLFWENKCNSAAVPL